MKVKFLTSTLAFLALTILSTPSSMAAPKVGVGIACTKPGTKTTINGLQLICMKESPQPKWRAMPKPTTPSPTPSSIVSKLAITPIVSLTKPLPSKSEPNTNSAVASIYLDFASKLASSRYYVVMNSVGRCWSGPVGTTLRSATSLESAISRGLFTSIDFGKRVKVIEIPTYPFSLECYLNSFAEYKFAVIETPLTTQFTLLGISPITTVEYPDFVAPTPKPSVTPNYSSELKIIAGQICAPEGFSAKASDGLSYVCKRSSSDASLRWVQN
jgi:hypothetical protein